MSKVIIKEHEAVNKIFDTRKAYLEDLDQDLYEKKDLEAWIAKLETLRKQVLKLPIEILMALVETCEHWTRDDYICFDGLDSFLENLVAIQGIKA
jgi:hypothetical protein